MRRATAPDDGPQDHQLAEGAVLGIAGRLEASGHGPAAAAIRRASIEMRFERTRGAVTAHAVVAVPSSQVAAVAAAEYRVAQAIAAAIPRSREEPLKVNVILQGVAEASGASDSERDEDLERFLGAENGLRIRAAMEWGMSPLALGALARWFQLESYLRQLVYIELRAKYGRGWLDVLPSRATTRAKKAQDRAYMGSVDDDYLLAHLDVSALLDLVSKDLWMECAHGIGLPQDSWLVRVEELKAIRHRLAHGRAPHRDDGSRIEQLLRDLEPAARAALQSYVTTFTPGFDIGGVVTDGWLRQEHPDAQRLVDHGRNQGIFFDLRYTVRPWATCDPAEGEPGCFWVLYVVLRDGGYIEMSRYARSSSVKVSLHHLGHIIQPSPATLMVTFPMVDDSTDIADAIGRCFEAVFEERSYYPPPVRWPPAADRLHDPRVEVGGLLSALHSMDPDDVFPLFRAT